MSEPSTAIQNLQIAAEQLLEKGQPEQAYNVFLQLAKHDPHNETYRLRIAEICVTLGRKQDAVRLLKHLAANLIAAGKIIPAISVNKRIMDIDPQETEIQKRLSEICAEVVPEAAAQTQAVARAEVQKIAASPLMMTPEAASSDIFDLASQMDLADSNTNVDLSISGHDGFNEISMRGDSPHLTLLGGSPARVTTPAIPLFSDLPPKAFEKIVEKCKRWSTPPETVLVRQGDQSDSLYIISYGTVRVLRKSGSAIKEIALLQAGDFFGEFAYFSRQPREATLVAASPVEVLEILREDIDRVILEYPKVERAMQNLYRERVLKNLLRENEIFSLLSDTERDEFAKRFHHRSVAKGQTIVREGDAADSFYVIQAGSVSVVKNGVAQPLAVLKEGDCFGEYAMITNAPRTASVIAQRDCDLVLLNREAFYDLLKSKPAVLERVKQIAKARLTAPR